MRKVVLSFVLFLFGLSSILMAQTTLDPNQFVNTQITGDGTYLVEAGNAYAFDGRIDLTYNITIEGPDNGWILDATNPPVLVNTPGTDGAARQFFEIKEGGSITVKNVIMSGMHSNDEVVGTFIANTAGSGFIVDNCAFVDWLDFALRNQNKGTEISITNCVFINGVRLTNSPWGGFPMRMDVACDEVLVENNTVVNSGRLLCNSGPFFNANIHEIHNSYLNQAVNGHEQRANEFITANNMFYNYHFLGRKGGVHSSPSNTYDASFTTWNYFADAKDSLEKISLYLGQNLFYRPDAMLDWFTNSGGDSILPSLLWEHANVDSFVTIDTNYKIGTNYAEFDPDFTVAPSNADAIVNFLNDYWLNPTGDWVDWRIESPVTFDGDGLPVLSWPPAFDLSYSNTYLQTAGTDGLPIGDLNWWPTEKATYLANRTSYLASLKDSIENATALYVPGSATPMKTPTTAIGDITDITPGEFSLSQNYPNPFNPSTSFKFNVVKAGKISLKVYNTSGQLVKTIFNNKNYSAGAHRVKIDMANFSSGVYFSVLNNGSMKITRKMMLLK